MTRNDVLKGLTTVGFLGYGLLHLALAWVAVQIALGQGGQEADQAGAFRTLAGQPFGEVLLWFVVVCLVALAVWQAILAARGHRDTHGRERAFERLASAARVVVYGALAVTAGKIVVGVPASPAQQQQQAAAGLMAKPAGAWLVGLVGLGVLAFGLGMMWYGGKRKFERKLTISQPGRRRTAVRAGQVGYIAKGLAFGVVGYVLLEAAVKNNPAKSRGLDAALHTVAGQPHGKFLLIVVALGIAVFAVFCWFQARYRKVGS